MAAQITIPVSNVASLIGLGFTRIEIWQSKDEGNSYQEITASLANQAFLDSAPPHNFYRVGGRVLKFVIDGGSEQVVEFSTLIEYWTAAQVVGRINEISVGTASEVNGVVRLSSPTVGRSSSVLITASDISDLGWFPGDNARGHDPRIILVNGVFVYTYIDIAGSTSDRYKWRFSNNGAPPLSEFSERVFGTNPAAAVPIAIATATFVGVDGKPEKRRVVIVSAGLPQVLGGYVTGNEGPTTVDADSNGFLQATLVQGARVRVAIEGTAFVREFVVPSTATFDLMTVMAAAPDPFTVQVPAPQLTRRSF